MINWINLYYLFLANKKPGAGRSLAQCRGVWKVHLLSAGEKREVWPYNKRRVNKFQISNYKFQIKSKLLISKFTSIERLLYLEFKFLAIICYLVLVIWNFTPPPAES